MLHCSALRLLSAECATAPKSVPTDPPLSSFVRFLTANHAQFDGVELRPSASQFRGLFARRTFRTGTTVLSVPLHSLAITSERLLTCESVRARSPPTLEAVRRLMLARSVKDPVLCEQLHLSLLLAAARLDADCAFAPYLDALPCPAVDDAAVMALHKDALDPPHLVEWDDHQREFLTAIRTIASRWGAAGPPVELCYWAWRTVLARMHLLPDRGLAPAELGSALRYDALSAVGRAERQSRLWRRMRAALFGVVGTTGPTATTTGGAESYRLVPTLVPLLDMTGHLASGNVSVEVQPRPGVGSCAELQATREIASGEEIGISFNRSHSPAFALYRFGFIPL